MSITAKELAGKLGLSATAVSMALNNRPGVSTETRRRILEAAEKYGYNFSNKPINRLPDRDIYFIAYRAYNTVLNYQGIFFEMYEGMEQECKKHDYHIKIIHTDGSEAELIRMMEELRLAPVAGIILLGTAITKEACSRFLSGFPWSSLIIVLIV